MTPFPRCTAVRVQLSAVGHGQHHKTLCLLMLTLRRDGERELSLQRGHSDEAARCRTALSSVLDSPLCSPTAANPLACPRRCPLLSSSLLVRCRHGPMAALVAAAVAAECDVLCRSDEWVVNE